MGKKQIKRVLIVDTNTAEPLIKKFLDCSKTAELFIARDYTAAKSLLIYQYDVVGIIAPISQGADKESENYHNQLVRSIKSYNKNAFVVGLTNVPDVKFLPAFDKVYNYGRSLGDFYCFLRQKIKE